MDQIDFHDERVKETISKLSLETGMSLTEIIDEFKYFSENVTYVRFKSGKYKGTVGYIAPNKGFDPYEYTKEVHTKDAIIWCPRWETELVMISKEEYEKAIGERN